MKIFVLPVSAKAKACVLWKFRRKDKVSSEGHPLYAAAEILIELHSSFGAGTGGFAISCGAGGLAIGTACGAWSYSSGR
jgi:hypothetical protein